MRTTTEKEIMQDAPQPLTDKSPTEATKALRRGMLITKSQQNIHNEGSNNITTATKANKQAGK